jgi:hypothetical protein
MESGVQYLHRAGADGEALAIFAGMADSGRYLDDRVLVKLARIVVGKGGGPNRDSPWYELAQFCAALSGLGIVGGARLGLLLGLEDVLPSTIRQAIAETAGTAAHVECDNAGLTITSGGSRFAIRYSRMPVLMALYEFVSSIDDYGFFAELQSLLDDLQSPAITTAEIQQAASAISSRMRRYRRAHMAYGRREEKFDRISGFLSRVAGEGGNWRIDDEAVLAFWLEHAEGREFRTFRSAYESFLSLLGILQEARRADAAGGALVIGSDREAGEIDIEDRPAETLDEWLDPFALFEREGLEEVKFFKASTERRPLQAMMRFGPALLELPAGFLRHEVFGDEQAAIIVDQQLKRDPARTALRIKCSDTQSYCERLATIEGLLGHMRRLQLACLHLVAGDRIQGDLATEAERTFRRLKRKGMAELEGDESRRLLIAEAAEALVIMSDHMSRCIGQLRNEEISGDECYIADRAVFAGQFRKLYGGDHG